MIKKSLVALLGFLALLAAWVMVDPQVRQNLEWRGQFVRLKLQGDIPIGWRDLIRTSGPGESNKAYLLVKNPNTSAADVAKGVDLYQARCASCHGSDGTGNTGPDLTKGYFRHGSTDLNLYLTILNGVTGTPMRGYALTSEELWQLVAFIRNLSGSLHGGKVTRDVCLPCRSVQVPYERLVHADREPGNWLTYSGNYQGHNYSPLDQIEVANVGKLNLKWVFQMPTLEKVKTTPLVVDGVMYVVQPPNDVIALDVRTGKTFWSYRRNIPERVPTCCGRTNRGLAILGDRIYMGTLDAHLVALDAKTGTVIWDVEVGDNKDGIVLNSAPLAVKDKIVVGIADSDNGIRGFLDAYDANSGTRAWRRYTIPAPGEPGSETWEGDSWRLGGGATWMTGSFDPELGLIYWGVANPAPSYDGAGRKGDNLYTNSVIAVEPETGEIRWYFQFNPHDVFDYDAAHVPVLVDVKIRGEDRRLLLFAQKNGFFYVLDRENGKLLLAREFVKQTWAEATDPQRKPVSRPNAGPTLQGSLVYPSNGTLWYPPSFDSTTGLFYVSAIEGGATLILDPVSRMKPGVNSVGGRWLPLEESGVVRALVPETGEIKWEYKGCGDTACGGLLSTAGNLVFGGSRKGLFFAVNASTGDEVWRTSLGGLIMASPVAYLSEGRQQISIASGGAIFTFGLDEP
jgi:alcohol dehydrogenase (cytochrome c)